jgi:alpha-beta hydrolase superfamily lysophospholipase
MNLKRLLIGKWNWKRPFISLGSIYLMLAIFAVSCADSIIFQPPHPTYTQEIEGFTKIPAANHGTVAALHLKAKPDARTILYSHGNAEDIGQLIEIFTALNDLGFGVIAYDYPGYGLSPGKPSEATTEQSIQAAWDYAIQSGISPSNLVILGQSIGTGPSVWLSSTKKPAGLILISPMKSVYSIPFKYPIFPGDRFPSIKRIKTINTPLLVIHGRYDEVIPYNHGVAIYENSPAKKKSLKTIENCGHNDLYYRASDEIFDSIEHFINDLPKP